jgi:hypothetical protein
MRFDADNFRGVLDLRTMCQSECAAWRLPRLHKVQFMRWRFFIN